MWYVQFRTSRAADPSYTLSQHACVETIEALLLRALYTLLNNDPGSAQKVWGNLGLIIKLAMSVSGAYSEEINAANCEAQIGLREYEVLERENHSTLPRP
jgi:hypothetical protein